MKPTAFYSVFSLFLMVFVLLPATAASDGTRSPVALEIDGVTLAQFTEVSGIGFDTEVIEHIVVDGEGKETTRKIPGRHRWDNIVLKRGLTAQTEASRYFWDWRTMVVDGDISEARRNGSLVYYDNTGAEIARWNFINAWPSKVSVQGGPSVLTEEVVIVVETIERG